MNQFLSLTLEHNAKQILVNVAQIQSIVEDDGGAYIAAGGNEHYVVSETIDQIQSTLGLMAQVASI